MDLSFIWDHFKIAIDQAAEFIIPYSTTPKVIVQTKPNNDHDQERKNISRLRNDIKRIRAFAIYARSHLDKEIDDHRFVDGNILIEKLNMNFDCQFKSLGKNWTMPWIIDTNQNIRLCNNILASRLKSYDTNKIKLQVDKRCAYIATNQRSLVNSLMNKTFRSIKLDRAVNYDEEGHMELITEPELLKIQCDKEYGSMFRKRNHQFDSDSENWIQWKTYYEPLKGFNDNIYKGLDDIPSYDEIMVALATRKDSSAPGTSNIGYAMIKHLPRDCIIALGKFFHICFRSSQVPLQWKWSSLYPIPKPKDWNYRISITRPILLIECTRKLMMKIFTTRLSGILQDHNILKGLNFTALKGESTSSPIALLQCIMEDAREKNNELWIVCQDMAKAFDSVGLTPLRFALERLKLPLNIVSFIINIFKERHIQIITYFGLTNGFVAQDGIDQGEIISPLLWRIFYDPLLCRIQGNSSFGYVMKWHGHTQADPLRIAASAFADDTIWIGKSRTETQSIIDMSNTFFLSMTLKSMEINQS